MVYVFILLLSLGNITLGVTCIIISKHLRELGDRILRLERWGHG